MSYTTGLVWSYGKAMTQNFAAYDSGPGIGNRTTGGLRVVP